MQRTFKKDIRRSATKADSVAQRGRQMRLLATCMLTISTSLKWKMLTNVFATACSKL